MKICRQCLIEKADELFRLMKKAKHPYRLSKCSQCYYEDKKLAIQMGLKEKEHKVKSDKVYREKNRKSIYLTQAIWRENNKDKVAISSKRTKLKNIDNVNTLTAKRRACKLQRIPSWTTETDIWMMQEIYELSALRTKLTGVKWEVDHIIPLQGKLVSGLHMPFNMQVIPAMQNRIKKNKFEVQL
jgi:hypothetical protein